MAFREGPDTTVEFDDWLIGFYESRIIRFMDGMGEFTNHGTFISPVLLKSTMRRYMELLENKFSVENKI